jgi:hypothetical protein
LDAPGLEPVAFSGADFKLIAIRPGKGCAASLLKVLKEEQCYSFTEAYSIGKEDEIIYDPSKDNTLYTTGGIRIEIAAIVGRNGTGKSALCELFLAAVNNIAYMKWKAGELQIIAEDENEKPKWLKNIWVDIYVKSNNVIKISLRDSQILITEYIRDGNQYNLADKKIRKLSAVPLAELFYSIIVNYSHHALNETHIGNWLIPLFRKNDGYQLPIGLDPYREEGNIDINRQESLTKSRIVANVLEYEGDPQAGEFRNLTDYQRAKTLRLNLEIEKTSTGTTSAGMQMEDVPGYQEIIGEFFDVFKIPETLLKHIDKKTVQNAAIRYIFRKLLRITEKYYCYKTYYKVNGLMNKKKYFKKLVDDMTHRAFKLHQAVNYLKYTHLPKRSSFDIDILTLSKKINQLKENNTNLRTIDLIPPAFFNVDILLEPIQPVGRYERDLTFNGLSSGEKQQILSINSIVYHLRNIDSVHEARDTDLVKYRYVNIFLDEIELYFHPEFQRNYLRRLLKSIRQVPLNYIWGINFVFITHSPFILSDIPKTTVLFLDMGEGNKAIPLMQKPDTFGANIHDLLACGFFMKDSIGSFAREKIAQIVDFYERLIQQKDTDKAKLAEEYRSRKDEFYFIHANIGEIYVKNIIANHLTEIEKRLETHEYLDKRLSELRDEMTKIEMRKNAKN